jgi:hypothetical protein
MEEVMAGFNVYVNASTHKSLAAGITLNVSGKLCALPKR